LNYFIFYNKDNHLKELETNYSKLQAELKSFSEENETLSKKMKNLQEQLQEKLSDHGNSDVKEISDQISVFNQSKIELTKDYFCKIQLLSQSVSTFLELRDSISKIIKAKDQQLLDLAYEWKYEVQKNQQFEEKFNNQDKVFQDQLQVINFQELSNNNSNETTSSLQSLYEVKGMISFIQKDLTTAHESLVSQFSKMEKDQESLISLKAILEKVFDDSLTSQFQNDLFKSIESAASSSPNQPEINPQELVNSLNLQEEQISTLSSQLESVQKILSETSTTLLEKQKEIETLELEHQQLSLSLKEKEKEIIFNQQLLEENKNALASTEKQKNETVCHLEDSLEITETEIDYLREELNGTTSENKKLDSFLKDAESEVIELKSLLELTSAEVFNIEELLKYEVREKNDEISSLNAKIEYLEIILERRNTTLSSLNQKLNDFDQLEGTFRNVTTQLTSMFKVIFFKFLIFFYFFIFFFF